MESPKTKTQFSSSSPEKPINEFRALAISAAGKALDMVVSYRECRKNHAASFGGHALDGCGEFMPSSADSLNCAACGCHRNFHRRHVPPHSPPPSKSPPSSPSPYSYYAPHALLNQTGFDQRTAVVRFDNAASNRTVKKRSRTRFTEEQKIKMKAFADKIGWKINGCDEKSISDFCNEIGIHRTVLRVWIHNNKYSVHGKKQTANRLCLNSNNKNRFERNGFRVYGCKNEEDGARLHVSGDGSSST